MSAIFEILLFFIGFFSIPFGYYRRRNWTSTSSQSVIWAVLAVGVGLFCLRLLMAFNDAGGDISGGYGKMTYGIFLLVALPTFSCLFGLAAISTYLRLKGTWVSMLFFPALALLVMFLWISVSSKLSEQSQVEAFSTSNSSGPLGSTKRDGDAWARDFGTNIEECKSVSTSKAFQEGCSRRMRGHKH